MVELVFDFGQVHVGFISVFFLVAGLGFLLYFLFSAPELYTSRFCATNLSLLVDSAQRDNHASFACIIWLASLLRLLRVFVPADCLPGG